jgi:pyruvate kinase
MVNGQFVRAKIVCTIGPASEHPETMEAMALVGMDVARVNLSHGDLGSHRKVLDALREMEGVSTLIDLPGPKIRIGDVDGGVFLRRGDSVHFTTRPVLGDGGELSVSYGRLPREVTVGGSMFIDDGLIEVSVTSIDDDLEGFQGTVVSGGEVTSHKGVNVPGADLTVRTPTESDLKGIQFGVGLCDWFAVSFVRVGQDIEAARRAIAEAGGDQPVVSKIEHREAITNIDEIIEASDGVMVARGDLGIEVPPWEVPLLQKTIIGKCNAAGKPVIVATQMLESMATSPRPTRAEASDVANAILDGADAVMLSGETAVGLFPVEAVRVMNEISLTVEREAPRREVPEHVEGTIPDVIGDLAARATDTVDPAAIIVVTRSGFTARMVSKHRPPTRILAVARSRDVLRRLEEGLIDRSDVVLIVSGSTLEAPGGTSTLEILSVEDVLSHASK